MNTVQSGGDGKLEKDPANLGGIDLWEVDFYIEQGLQQCLLFVFFK